MKRFKKILFFADGAPGERTALSRAVVLAEHNGAELTVIDVVAKIGSNETNSAVKRAIKSIQKALIKEREDVLEQVIREVMAGRGKPKVRSLVIPGKDLEIIEVVEDQKFDLIVKAADRKSALGAIFGHTDLRLMRKSSCPVWIIKASRRRRFKTILAAVDPTPETRDSVNLNTAILEIAGSLAEREGAALHVIHAWEFPVDPRWKGKLEKDHFEELYRSVKEDSERKLRLLLDDYPHFTMQDHLVRGKPEDLIPRFVRNHDIDLLVMGTVARTGVPGFFIGNTAEKVLNTVDCSVLTLKPRGFKVR